MFTVRTTRHQLGAALRVVLLLSAAMSLPACAGKSKNNSLAGASRGGGKSGGMNIPFTPFRIPGSGGNSSGSSAPINMDEVRSQVMSLADTYTQTVVQSLDALVATSKDPQRVNWARKQRLATMSVSLTNATGPNAVVGLLDMVVFATLKRDAVEQHWVPTLLGDEGKPVAEAHRRGEAEAWAAAERVLSRAHCNQLRQLIEEWRLSHPGQYYVGYTRFSDFDAYRNLSPQSPEAKNPGSLFSVFYVDPLAGLDPVARELRSYRMLTERIAYIGSRLPILAAYQVDLAVGGAIESPEFRTFVASTEKFAGATQQFAHAVSGYPKDLAVEREAAVKDIAAATARERQAAIEQASRSIAAEREAILKEIEAQDGRIRGITGEVSRLIAQAEKAGANLNTSAAQTITTTEDATRRTLDHAFRLSAILVLIVLLGMPLVLLTYRLVNRRLLAAPSMAPYAQKS
jgi:hypothetical protein